MSKSEHSVANKVFSYSKIERIKKNYSRKNFADTLNKEVVFDSCTFQNTIFHRAQIVQCRFINCTFIDFDFNHTTFSKNIFSKCKFSGILFYKCIFDGNNFEDCSSEKSSEYPCSGNVAFLQQNGINIQYSSELNDVLKKAILHKHIRESNTIFKKKRNSWPKSTKQELRKVSKKEGDKLGLSKKMRLAENARRKKQRNELLRQNYEDSQQGKNRILDKGLMSFLLLKYTESELINGLDHCISMINFRFNSISYLIKYIDQTSK